MATPLVEVSAGKCSFDPGFCCSGILGVKTAVGKAHHAEMILICNPCLAESIQRFNNAVNFQGGDRAAQLLQLAVNGIPVIALEIVGFKIVSPQQKLRRKNIGTVIENPLRHIVVISAAVLVKAAAKLGSATATVLRDHKGVFFSVLVQKQQTGKGNGIQHSDSGPVDGLFCVFVQQSLGKCGHMGHAILAV